MSKISVNKKQKSKRKYKPTNPAEADLMRGAELVFDIVVDNLQLELIDTLRSQK